MTVSARRVLNRPYAVNFKKFGLGLGMLNNFPPRPSDFMNPRGTEAEEETPPASEPEPDPVDVDKLPQMFTDAVQLRYVEQAEEEEPPIKTIYKTAEKCGLVALVNGQNKRYWTARRLSLIDFDVILEISLLRRDNILLARFQMLWPEPSVVALLSGAD